MKLIIPDDLAHVNITLADIRRIAPHLKSWDYTSKIYRDIDADELAKYIVVELNYKKRVSVLDRLVGRYAKYRRKILSNQIASSTDKFHLRDGSFVVNDEIAEIIEDAA